MSPGVIDTPWWDKYPEEMKHRTFDQIAASVPLRRIDEGRDYLGFTLDDPSFTAPIFANPFGDEDGEGYSLIGSRPNGRRSD